MARFCTIANSPIWRRNQPTSPNANNQASNNRPPNDTSANRPNNATSANRSNTTSANQATNATSANRPNVTNANQASNAARVAKQSIIANNITLDRIRGLYPDIRKKRTHNALLDAHRDVLAYGQQTGNELLIVINTRTGETVLSQSGIINNVTFDLERIRNQRVILVHNHPNDAAFSPGDMITLNRRSDIDYISVQTPSGRMYSLSIGDGIRAREIGFANIQKFFDDIDNLGRLSVSSILEANRHISERYGWNFIEGN